MRIIILIALSALLLGNGGEADYSELKYKKVAALLTDATGGTVIPNGEKIAVTRFVGSGAEPTAYSVLAFCWGTPAKEKIFASTRGDVNIEFDQKDATYQATGDGVCKLQIIIVNDNAIETPIVGGSYEATNI